MGRLPSEWQESGVKRLLFSSHSKRNVRLTIHSERYMILDIRAKVPYIDNSNASLERIR